jgi:hypothetical protein
LLESIGTWLLYRGAVKRLIFYVHLRTEQHGRYAYDPADMTPFPIAVTHTVRRNTFAERG